MASDMILVAFGYFLVDVVQAPIPFSENLVTFYLSKHLGF